jgi:hypothetical protein
MVGLGETSDWRTVVGVVGNVLLGNPLSRDRSPIAAYIPLRQTEVQGSAVVFRHRGSRAGGQGAFHQTFSDLDPLMAPGTVASFDEMLGKTTLIAKSVAALFGACFAFALLLALSGTYGLRLGPSGGEPGRSDCAAPWAPPIALFCCCSWDRGADSSASARSSLCP